jgi:tetratricopeptide (TPR) repeat protein
MASLAPSDGTPPAGRGAWEPLLAPLGILLLGLFAYGNSLHGPFVFDDIRQIRDNPSIRDLAASLRSGGFGSPPSRYFGYLTFALNHRVGGLEVFGYHLVNLAIHLAVSLLVYRLVQLLFRTPVARRSRLAPGARGVAFVAGTLFATHPLGTQAVTYVVQRLTSLATLLYLLAVVLYLAWRLAGDPPRAGAGRRAALYGGVIVSALLAMRTKEIAFTLPGAILLVELLFFPAGGFRRWLPVLPVGGIALAVPAAWVNLQSGVGTLSASAERATRVQTSVSRIDYLRTQVVVVTEYLRLLAWPTGQNLDHDIPIRRATLDPSVLGPALLLAALLATAVGLARGTRTRPERIGLDPALRLVSFGIGWFFLALAVESGVIPILDVMYEHRVYLPGVGVSVAAATLLGMLFLRVAPGREERLSVLAGVALAILLGSLTLRRNAVWSSALTLWSDAASKSPGKARPHLLLAEALEAAGRTEEAEREFRRAVAIDPDDVPGRTALATFLQKARRGREAEEEYGRILLLDPGHRPAIFNLADLLWRSGRREEASVLYRRYLELPPAGDGAGRAIAGARVGAERAGEAPRVPPP